jgi:hypothetical protein
MSADPERIEWTAWRLARFLDRGEGLREEPGVGSA